MSFQAIDENYLEKVRESFAQSPKGNTHPTPKLRTMNYELRTKKEEEYP
ncbi:MAG: hypothetical protein ACYDG6_03200 [Thermincolia bacterium]